MAETARGGQGLHELVERQFLPRKRLERRRAHLLQELAEGQAVGKPAAQNQGVGEKADQLFGLQSGAVRDRCSHQEIGLA